MRRAARREVAVAVTQRSGQSALLDPDAMDQGDQHDDQRACGAAPVAQHDAAPGEGEEQAAVARDVAAPEPADADGAAGPRTVPTASRWSPAAGVRRLSSYSTVSTSEVGGIRVRAAYPPALSAMALVAPAWTQPCCWLTSGRLGSAICTDSGTTWHSRAARSHINPCRSKLARMRSTTSGGASSPAVPPAMSVLPCSRSRCRLPVPRPGPPRLGLHLVMRTVNENRSLPIGSA